MEVDVLLERREHVFEANHKGKNKSQKGIRKWTTMWISLGQRMVVPSRSWTRQWKRSRRPTRLQTEELSRRLDWMMMLYIRQLDSVRSLD